MAKYHYEHTYNKFIPKGSQVFEVMFSFLRWNITNFEVLAKFLFMFIHSRFCRPTSGNLRPGLSVCLEFC